MKKPICIILMLLFSQLVFVAPVQAQTPTPTAAVSLTCLEIEADILLNVTQTVNVTCTAGNPTSWVEKVAVYVITSENTTRNVTEPFEIGGGSETTFEFEVDLIFPMTEVITISVTVQELNGLPPINQADSTYTLGGGNVKQFGDGCATYGNPTFDNSKLLMNVSWVDNNGEPRTENITLQLDYLAAPIHSNNFRILSALGCYDNVSFHRVINNFMIQGGDFTNGDGTGGHAAKWYGYCNGVVEASSTACVKTSWTIPDEASNGLKHTAGALSMAKTANANTGGSQFFVVPSDSNPSHLDGKHTVFGYVTDGMEHIDSISEAPTHGENGNQIPPDKPLNDVTLVSVTTDSTQKTPWYRILF